MAKCYLIKNRLSGFVVTEAGNGDINVEPLEKYRPTPNQLWYLDPLDGDTNTFYIVSHRKKSYGQVLDICQESTSASTPIILYNRKSKDASNQLWKRDGSCIVSKLNPPFGPVFLPVFLPPYLPKQDLVLDVASKNPGAHVVSMPRDKDAPSQMWDMEEYVPKEEKYVLTDVKYDIAQVKPIETAPEIVARAPAINTSKNKATVKCDLDYTLKSSLNWGNSLGIKAGVKTTLEVGVPFVVDGKVEVSASASYVHSWGSAIETTKKVHTGAEVVLNPGCQATIKVVAKRLTMDIPYTATLRTEFADGTTTTMKIKGTYKGVTMVDIQTNIED